MSVSPSRFLQSGGSAGCRQKAAGSGALVWVAPATNLASRMQTGLPSRKAWSAASTVEPDMFSLWANAATAEILAGTRPGINCFLLDLLAELTAGPCRKDGMLPIVNRSLSCAQRRGIAGRLLAQDLLAQDLLAQDLAANWALSLPSAVCYPPTTMIHALEPLHDHSGSKEPTATATVSSLATTKRVTCCQQKTTQLTLHVTSCACRRGGRRCRRLPRAPSSPSPRSSAKPSSSPSLSPSSLSPSSSSSPSANPTISNPCRGCHKHGSSSSARQSAFLSMPKLFTCAVQLLACNHTSYPLPPGINIHTHRQARQPCWPLPLGRTLRTRPCTRTSRCCTTTTTSTTTSASSSGSSRAPGTCRCGWAVQLLQQHLQQLRVVAERSL